MDYGLDNQRHNVVLSGQHSYSYVHQTHSTSSPIPISQGTPENLTCNERLDRASPDLWPESVPGILEKNRDSGLQLGPQRQQKFKTEMDQDDVRLVNDLGRLSADQLMEYVRNLQNSAFVLGVEEKKQFAKGKFLKIFEKRTDEVYT